MVDYNHHQFKVALRFLIDGPIKCASCQRKSRELYADSQDNLVCQDCLLFGLQPPSLKKDQRLFKKIFGPYQFKKLIEIGYSDINSLANVEFSQLAEQLGSRISAQRIRQILIRAGISNGRLFASS